MQVSRASVLDANVVLCEGGSSRLQVGRLWAYDLGNVHQMPRLLGHDRGREQQEVPRPEATRKESQAPSH